MNKQTFVIKQGCVSYRKTHSYKSPRLISNKTSQNTANEGNNPNTRRVSSPKALTNECNVENNSTTRRASTVPKTIVRQGVQYHEDYSDFEISQPGHKPSGMATAVKGPQPGTTRKKVQRKSRRQMKREDNQSTLTNWLSTHRHSGRTNSDLIHENFRSSNRVNSFNVLCDCLLYTSPSPRDKRQSRMPSSA